MVQDDVKTLIEWSTSLLIEDSMVHKSSLHMSGSWLTRGQDLGRLQPYATFASCNTRCLPAAFTQPRFTPGLALCVTVSGRVHAAPLGGNGRKGTYFKPAFV